MASADNWLHYQNGNKQETALSGDIHFCTVHVGLRNQMWIQAVTGTAGEKDLAVRTNSGCAGLLGTLHCVLVQVVAHHPLGSFLIGASDTCDTAMHPLVDNIFCLVHLSTASHNPVNINS